MTADTSPRPDDGTPIARLWMINIAPPVLVLLDLQLAYMLVDHACRSRGSAVLHLVHAVILGLALVIGAVAWRSWLEFGRENPDDTADLRTRSRFMSVLGLMASALSVLTILAQWMAEFFLSPCQ